MPRQPVDGQWSHTGPSAAGNHSHTHDHHYHPYHHRCKKHQLWHCRLTRGCWPIIHGCWWCVAGGQVGKDDIEDIEASMREKLSVRPSLSEYKEEDEKGRVWPLNLLGAGWQGGGLC